MVAARLSPSGLANRYSAIPFTFPAAVELEGLGALSDALVYRRRYNKYAVVSEKKLILIGAKADMDTYLKKWRKTTVNRICEVFELVKEAKIEKFSKKSYFYRKANGLQPAESDNNPDSTDKDKAQAHGFEEPEIKEKEDDDVAEGTGIDIDTNEM
jgi:hypothetical protein